MPRMLLCLDLKQIKTPLIRNFKSWPKTAESLNYISDQKNIDQTPFNLSNLMTSKMEALKAASHKSLPPTNGQQFMIHSIDNV